MQITTNPTLPVQGYALPTKQTPLVSMGGMQIFALDHFKAIFKQLLEPRNMVNSMRQLNKLGQVCRLFAEASYSKDFIALLLGKGSPDDPSVPFNIQEKLAAFCGSSLKKWKITNISLYQNPLSFLSRAFRAAPALEEVYLQEDHGRSDIVMKVKELYQNSQIIPKNIKKFTWSSWGIEKICLNHPDGVAAQLASFPWSSRKDALSRFTSLTGAGRMHDGLELVNSIGDEKCLKYIYLCNLSEEHGSELNVLQNWHSINTVSVVSCENEDLLISLFSRFPIGTVKNFELNISRYDDQRALKVVQLLRLIPTVFPNLKKIKIHLSVPSFSNKIEEIVSPLKTGLQKLRSIDYSFDYSFRDRVWFFDQAIWKDQIQEVALDPDNIPNIPGIVFPHVKKLFIRHSSSKEALERATTVFPNITVLSWQSMSLERLHEVFPKWKSLRVINVWQSFPEPDLRRFRAVVDRSNRAIQLHLPKRIGSIPAEWCRSRFPAKLVGYVGRIAWGVGIGISSLLLMRSTSNTMVVAGSLLVAGGGIYLAARKWAPHRVKDLSVYLFGWDS